VYRSNLRVEINEETKMKSEEELKAFSAGYFQE